MVQSQALIIGSISVFISIIVFGIRIFMSRRAARTARQKFTLEFIRQYNSDDKVSLGHAALRRAKEQSPGDILSGKERDIILFLLNQFEILAIGCNLNAYDKSMIKNTFTSDICGIYNDARHIIAHIRAEDATGATGDIAFEEFEKLAMKLMKKSGH